MGEHYEERLRLLANPINQQILTTLAVEPSHARRLGHLLHRSESDVSRRLKALQMAGFLSVSWAQQGTNVRRYKLEARQITVQVGRTGVSLTHAGGQGGAARLTLDANVATAPPVSQGFVGRHEMLAKIENGPPVVLIEGLPGIGKTSLAARIAKNQPHQWVTCRGAETLPWLANLAAQALALQGDGTLLTELDLEPDHRTLGPRVLAALDQPGQTTIIDDVHKISDDTLRHWLSDAIERFENGQLILLGRQAPPHGRSHGLLKLRLEGLTQDEVRDFLESKQMPVDAPMLERIGHEVGGHPLALHLLTEAAGDLAGLEPLLDRRPERALTDYLLQEIDSSLSETEKTALAHASLFAFSFRRPELEKLGNRSLEGPLLALRRRNLVIGREDGLRLHEVVRNFYAQRVADPVGLHKRAATLCLERGTVDGRLEAMHHLLAANHLEPLLELLQEDLDLRDYDKIDAGYHALYADILARFQRSEVDDKQWAQILDERGDLAFHSQQWSTALQHYADAATLFGTTDQPTRVWDSMWKQSLCEHQIGDNEAAATSCRAALKLKPEGKSLERLERLLAELAPN